jgi:hypothetical protein
VSYDRRIMTDSQPSKTGQYISGKFFSNVKYEAARRGIEFDLTIDFLDGLIRGQNHKCYYTELPIDAKTRDSITASLDRLDSSKGYTKDNVHFVIKDVNMMKWTLKEKRFTQLCKLVAKVSDDKKNLEEI